MTSPRTHRGLVYAVDPEVYEPAEDTFLLVDHVLEADLRGRRVVELGCGAGLAAAAAARSGARRVTAVDLHAAAVRLARRNARANERPGDARVAVVRGDLLAPLRGPVDVALFNPPYLPTGPDDAPPGGRRTPLFDAWDAGPRGLDVALRLADQVERAAASPWAAAPRELWLVASTLQDLDALRARFEGLGYRRDDVREVALPHERLLLWIWRRAP